MMGSRFCQASNVVTRNIGGEVFLVPVKGKLADLQRLFVLNKLGEYIWQQLDGARTQQEMVAAILERFEVDENHAAADLEEFLGQLKEANLVEEVV
jgi:hypothetical protein